MNIQRVSNSDPLSYRDIQVNPLDLACSEQSPCKGCRNINQDKELCLRVCERLKAYRKGLSYDLISPPEI